MKQGKGIFSVWMVVCIILLNQTLCASSGDDEDSSELHHNGFVNGAGVARGSVSPDFDHHGVVPPGMASLATERAHYAVTLVEELEDRVRGLEIENRQLRRSQVLLHRLLHGNFGDRGADGQGDGNIVTYIAALARSVQALERFVGYESLSNDDEAGPGTFAGEHLDDVHVVAEASRLDEEISTMRAEMLGRGSGRERVHSFAAAAREEDYFDERFGDTEFGDTSRALHGWFNPTFDPTYRPQAPLERRSSTPPFVTPLSPNGSSSCLDDVTELERQALLSPHEEEGQP